MKEVKRKLYLDIVNSIKKGLNPAKISTRLNISIPNLSYYLSSLKREGVIKKVGYGVWEVIPSGEVKILSQDGNSQVQNVRGHAFIWKIKPNKKFNWLEILKLNNINYELKGLQSTPRIIIERKKILLGKNYITIFEPKGNNFWGINTIDSKKNAIQSFLVTMEGIFKITGEFKYKFKVARQHYGFVNNLEAIHFEHKGKTILIKNEKGYWFSIDYSSNIYKEAETISEEQADIHGLQYQNYMNSHERTNFKVTPEFILEALNKVKENQNMYAENMVSHVEAIKTLSQGVKDLVKEVQELRRINNLGNRGDSD